MGSHTLAHMTLLLSNALLQQTLPHSYKESQTREEYIEEALKQGYICPSTFPALAIFMEIKEDGLQPSIDYCGLNQVSVKYDYPLER